MPVPVSTGATVRGGLRREWGLVGIVGGAMALDGLYSVVRHVTFRSGTDLAIFDQAVWHLSRLAAPVSTIKGENVFGDHFDPLFALLAPLYWVWADPIMLLLAQSALVAASIVPVFLFARSRLGRTGAYLVASAYAVFWGLQVGVGFDFHEVAFAPLLIALAILFADRRRWRAFWITLVLLLGVKEDLSLLVAFFGLYLISAREVRRGLVALTLGIVWYELATRWAIPHFATGHRFTYWSYYQLGSDLPDAAWNVLIRPWRLVDVLVTPFEKVRTLVALLGPFLFLSLLDRRFILALPLLFERFLSNNDLYWTTHYHYSMAVAPVLAMSAAAGLHNLGSRFSGARGARLVVATAAGMLSVGLIVTLFVIQAPTVRLLVKRDFYRRTTFAPGLAGALAAVPPGASVVAHDALLAHLGHRAFAGEIYSSGVADYLVANVSQPVENPGASGGVTWAQVGAVVGHDLQVMTPIYFNDGWVVARRLPPGHRPTNGVLAPLERRTAQRILAADFAWRAALYRAFAHLGGCAASLAHTDPHAANCFRAAGAGLDARQADLARSLDASSGQLVGGCRQLQHTAVIATRLVARDLAVLRQHGQAMKRSRLPADARRVRYDFYDLDLPGRLDRFLILCYSRR